MRRRAPRFGRACQVRPETQVDLGGGPTPEGQFLDLDPGRRNAQRPEAVGENLAFPDKVCFPTHGNDGFGLAHRSLDVTNLARHRQTGI